MNRLAIIVAALALPAAPAAAQSIVNINGAVTGCSTCDGSPHPVAGNTLGELYSPVLQTFGPGTYRVTNAVGQEGALYDAWRFNGSESNWIWSFIIADANTRKVVLDSLPDPNAFVGSHNAVAASSYALNYSGTFTLTAQTTLAFLTEDYYPGDNAGGVSLRIAPVSNIVAGVPEPAAWALMILGFGMAGAVMRRRRSAEARAQAA